MLSCRLLLAIIKVIILSSSVVSYIVHISLIIIVLSLS